MSNSSAEKLPGLARAFFEEVTKKHAPTASIVRKSESWLMKTIGFFLKPFNPEFHSYITTIGKTIYVPDDFFSHNEMAVLDIVTHETQHIIDYVNNPALFVLGYLFPQWLAVLGILGLFGIIVPPMFLFFFALLFLAPIPAPWRYLYELRGYRVSVLFGRHLHNFSEGQMTQVRERFKTEMTTGSYYFAWPFPSMIDRNIKDESFMSEPQYQEITEFIKRHIQFS